MKFSFSGLSFTPHTFESIINTKTNKSTNKPNNSNNSNKQVIEEFTTIPTVLTSNIFEYKLSNGLLLDHAENSTYEDTGLELKNFNNIYTVLKKPLYANVQESETITDYTSPQYMLQFKAEDVVFTTKLNDQSNERVDDSMNESMNEAMNESFEITDSSITDLVNAWIDDPDIIETEYGHISTWNVSEVTNMSGLFSFKGTFNDDISSWNVSNVTDMSEMFYGATIFNQDIGGWNVSV